jgi:XapX domain-containing protein
MKIYIISLAAGILVGVVYSLLHVRSPAPPLVALVGLLGILIGEQAIPVCRHILAGEPWRTACATPQTVEHILGKLPGHNTSRDDSGKA